MGVIKDLLKEELENSLRLKKEYAEELKKQKAGSIIKKNIGGHVYYYLAFREDKKVRFVYKGKHISPEDLRKNKEAKQRKLKYKELMRKLSSRIRYIKRALHGKEE